MQYHLAAATVLPATTAIFSDIFRLVRLFLLVIILSGYEKRRNATSLYISLFKP